LAKKYSDLDKKDFTERMQQTRCNVF